MLIDVEIITHTNESIIKLIEYCVKHPLFYFSEKTLQVFLVHLLLEKEILLKPKQTSIYENTKLGSKNNKNSKNNIELLSHNDNVYKTLPIHMDYGINLKGPYRVDIAILNPESIKEIVNVKFKNKDNQYIKPLVGIEIGTEKSGWKQMSSNHIENDLKKTNQCSNGYILNIMRNTNFSNEKTKRYENKENQMNLFKQSIKLYSKKNNNINIISIIINIFERKVDFLNKDNQWERFDFMYNNDYLIEAIRSRLKLNEHNKHLELTWR